MFVPVLVSVVPWDSEASPASNVTMPSSWRASRMGLAMVVKKRRKVARKARSALGYILKNMGLGVYRLVEGAVCL